MKIFYFFIFATVFFLNVDAFEISESQYILTKKLKAIRSEEMIFSSLLIPVCFYRKGMKKSQGKNHSRLKPQGLKKHQRKYNLKQP